MAARKRKTATVRVSGMERRILHAVESLGESLRAEMKAGDDALRAELTSAHRALRTELLEAQAQHRHEVVALVENIEHQNRGTNDYVGSQLASLRAEMVERFERLEQRVAVVEAQLGIPPKS